VGSFALRKVPAGSVRTRPPGVAAAGSLALTLATLAFAPTVHAVPLEVYGHLPRIEEVVLSPDGSRLALVKTEGNTRVMAVYKLAGREMLGGLRVGEHKLRGIRWADNDHVMLYTSVTARLAGTIDEREEWGQLQVYDVRSGKSVQIPETQSVSGVNVIDILGGPMMVRGIEGHTVLFGRFFQGFAPYLPALVSSDLDTGRTRVVRVGTKITYRWLVDSGGEVAAEVTYNQEPGRWAILTKHGWQLQETLSGYAPLEPPELLGFGPTPGTLLIETLEDGDPVWRLLSLKDGTLGEPMAERDKMEHPIEDRATNRMIGGVHVGDTEHWVFFDPDKQSSWDAVLHAFAGERVYFSSVTADFRKFTVVVEGTRDGYRYQLVDLVKHQAEPIGEIYEGVTPLEVRRITYAAADGLKIGAYLTLPRGKPPKNLPLIVLPHGGPALRDTLDLDWWSQALADQGWAVPRPNYRGSNVTWKLVTAGFGEWGRKMQTDLSDGVRYLATEGVIDPKRVCIVGASYGGYAALAGVTLDPGVYRCSVSVAGVSDLHSMTLFVGRESSPYAHDLALRYWDRFLGVKSPEDPIVATISPIKHIDAITVPVMLIHGKDDRVVPYDQSQMMFDAMRKAKKPVEFVTLKEEDHWLSRSATRLQMLESSVKFLRTNNPPD